MKKTVDHLRHDLVVGSVLRRVLPVFEIRHLTYDTRLQANCNDVVLGEIEAVPPKPPDPHEYYMERVFRGDRGLVFKTEDPRPGLIAVAVGNRYAPKALLGGLYNPVTGRQNGEVRGGTEVYDLGTYNLAGFINHAVAQAGRGRIRVLGTLLDAGGAPVNVENYRPRWGDAAPGPCRGVLVCGSGMESGKTTCCVALARGLRAHGLRVACEKKTGTASFRDSLRTFLDDEAMAAMTASGVTVDYSRLPASDFVESAGRVSDVSGPLDRFVHNSLAYTPGYLADRAADVLVVELADNVSHRSNLALLQDERFRRFFQALVYVPEPSFDAADHFLFFLRHRLKWRDIPVAFSGPVVNESRWVVLREEIGERLGAACVPSLLSVREPAYDTRSLAEWFLEHAGLPGR